MQATQQGASGWLRPVSERRGAGARRPWVLALRALAVGCVFLTLATSLWAGRSTAPQSSSGTAPTEAIQTRPLLWGIGSPPRSYLFGTIHLADPRVTRLAAAVTDAFASCDEIRTEIPLDAQSLADAAQGLMLPDNQTLSDVLPEELLTRIDAFLQERGLSLQPFSRLKPWGLASILTILDAGDPLLGTPLDQILYEKAVQTEKSVGGLETVEEQLDILDSLSRDEDATLLEETLGLLQKEDDYLEKLIRTYVAGDAEELLNMVYEFGDQENAVVEKYGRRLVDDRNAIMAQRIFALLQDNPEQRFFFAVGAGHLPGDMGIVRLLRDRGLVVERLHEP